MGLLDGALKLAGSVALGTVGVAATLARTAGNVAGSDLLADLAGTVQDKSFETIRDMWTPDEEKDEDYYAAQAERSERRAMDSVKDADQFKRRYEEERKKLGKEQHGQK